MLVSLEDMALLRKKHSDKTIVLAMGGFDLTHAGHVLFFEDCKRYGDILVVAVASDAARRKERGPSRPILNEHLRAKMVDSLKPVDYVYITRMAREDENVMAPADEVIEHLKPHVWVLNEDAYDMPRRKELAERFGFELVILPRSCPPEFENISTTGIIEKIKKSS